MDELWINGDFSIFSLFFLLCWLQYLGKNLHGCLVLISKCMFFDVFSILEKYICIFFFFLLFVRTVERIRSGSLGP